MLIGNVSDSKFFSRLIFGHSLSLLFGGFGSKTSTSLTGVGSCADDRG